MWGFVDDVADEAGDYDKPDDIGGCAWRFDDGLTGDNEADGAGGCMPKPTN